MGTIVTSFSELLLYLQRIKTSGLNLLFFQMDARWICTFGCRAQLIRLLVLLFGWNCSHLLRSIDEKEGCSLLGRWPKTSSIASHTCVCHFQIFLLYLKLVIIILVISLEDLKICAVSDQRSLVSLVTQVRSRSIFRLLLCGHLFCHYCQLATIFVILSVLKSCLLKLRICFLNGCLNCKRSSIMASFLGAT